MRLVKTYMYVRNVKSRFTIDGWDMAGTWLGHGWETSKNQIFDGLAT